MSVPARSAARQRLHDAGWDYWMARMFDIDEGKGDPQMEKLYRARLDEILEQIGTWEEQPKLPVSRTSAVQGKVTVDRSEFYDTDEVTPAIQAGIDLNVQPNEARHKLHDAGWDYWITRALRSNDLEEKHMCESNAFALLPLFTKDVHPWPLITYHHHADGTQTCTTENFYDVDTPPTSSSA